MTDIITPQDAPVYDSTAKVVVLNRDSTATEWTAAKVSTLIAERDSYINSAARNNNKVSQLKEYLRENYEELGEHATEIAEIFGLELTKTITWTVTARISVTAEVAPDFDPDDVNITEYISIDSTSPYYSTHALDDLSISDYDFDTEGWEEE